MSKLSCSFERQQYIQQPDLVWPWIMKVEKEMEPRREEVRIESHVMSIVPLELKLKEDTYYTLMIAVYNNISSI